MFDTVIVRPKILNISNNAELIIQEPAFNFGKKERGTEVILYKDSKKCISGAKAYFNNDKFSLTIKRNLNQYAQEPTVAVLQFSLPKQKGFNNTETVDSQGFNTALEELYKNIYRNGFDIDIENSKVVRFDCAANVNTKLNSKSFVNVFQTHDIPRMRKQIFPSSLLFYNRKEELNIYDKLKEQGLVKKNQFSEICRFEYRNKVSSVCRTKHNVNCFIDLKKNYNSIRSNYRDFVKTKFFSKLKNDSNISRSNLFSVFEYFKTNSKRNLSQSVISYLAYLYLSDNNAEPDFFDNLKSFNVSRNNQNVLQKRFSTFSILKKQFDSILNKHNYFDYVRELEKEFLKVS